MRDYRMHSHRCALALMILVLGVVQSARAAGPLVTLTQTSVTGPAATVFNGNLYIAWTGTDNPNHLNVAYTTDGVHLSTPVVIPNNSSVAWAGPGLAVFNGKLYLSWTGGSSRVNYISSSDGVHWGNQVVTNWAAEGSTSLTATATALYIGFAQATSPNTVSVDFTSDGTNWNVFANYNTGGAGSPYSPSVAIDPNGQLVPAYMTFPSTSCSWNCLVVGFGLVPGPLNPGVSAPGTSSSGGPGLVSFNGHLYVAWNGGFSGANNNGSILVANNSSFPWPYFAAGQSCRGNPALVAWNGHLYIV